MIQPLHVNVPGVWTCETCNAESANGDAKKNRAETRTAEGIENAVSIRYYKAIKPHCSECGYTDETDGDCYICGRPIDFYAARSDAECGPDARRINR